MPIAPQASSPRTWRRATCRSSCQSPRKHLLHILGDHVDLQVHGAAHVGAAQVRAFQRLGDQRHVEGRVVDPGDGQADAVDGDRALLNHVAQQLGRRLDGHHAGEAVLRDARDDADAVDVTLHDVAAQARVRAQGEIQVDLRAGLDVGQGRAPQRLVHHVEAEALPADAGGRQAHAVDGDAVALADLRAQPRLDGQHGAGARHVDGHHGPEVLDEAGEHHHSRRRALTRTSSATRLQSRVRARRAWEMRSTPSPSSGSRALLPPSSSGARNRRTSSISPASRNAPARCGPPSSRRPATPRSPSWSSAERTRAGSFWPVATSTSAPAVSSASVAERGAARETTTVSGTSWAWPTSLESSGRRAVASKTTRRGWRRAGTSGSSMRAVSCGSSASAVPMPTTTASTEARQRWASSRLASEEIHLESPVRVATLPSSVIADLNRTHGRPVRACLRKAWLARRARAASSPPATSTVTPSSRRMPRPRPEAFSVGSSAATTTRRMPASRIASVHGGVLPWWQQGSSET